MTNDIMVAVKGRRCRIGTAYRRGRTWVAQTLGHSPGIMGAHVVYADTRGHAERRLHESIAKALRLWKERRARKAKP